AGDAAAGDTSAGSLFERILAAAGDGSDGADREAGILVRGAHCFVLLNRFPYTSGHLMVLPNRAEAHLEGLSDAEHAELWDLVRAAVSAQRRGLGCDAVNVGLNLGVAAGGSQSDHLHVHCVPRWVGDANFMSVAADTRVLPVSLEEAWDRLRAVWEPPPGSGTVRS
ncbi:MAG: HIT family protein, partial [Microthrixaceae bacterium]